MVWIQDNVARGGQVSETHTYIPVVTGRVGTTGPCLSNPEQVKSVLQ